MRALPLVLLLLAAGCGLAERDVRMSVPLEADGTTECSTSGVRTVDLRDNEDFVRYRDHISSAELLSVRVLVREIGEGNKATVATGSALFRTADGVERRLFAYEVPLRAGAAVDVPPEPAAAGELMRQLLAPPHTADVFTKGTADALPCRFSFDLETNVRFIAKPSAIFQ